MRRVTEDHASFQVQNKSDHIEANLRLIFKAYAWVSANKKITRTFDLVQREFNVLRMGPFIKFCRDFRLPCKLTQHIMSFNRAYEQSFNRGNGESRVKTESGGFLEF